jgi:hypothetical protein
MLSWPEAVFAQAVPPAATVAEKFTLVHNSLLQHTLEDFKTIMAATGFLLPAIGWLLTSKEARSFLAEHRRARNLMLVAIWTVAALDLASQVEALRISAARLRLLERLAYIDRVYFEDHGVSWRYFFVNAGVHVALFFILSRLFGSLTQGPPLGDPESKSRQNNNEASV